MLRIVKYICVFDKNFFLTKGIYALCIGITYYDIFHEWMRADTWWVCENQLEKSKNYSLTEDVLFVNRLV